MEFLTQFLQRFHKDLEGCYSLWDIRVRKARVHRAFRAWGSGMVLEVTLNLETTTNPMQLNPETDS